MYTKELDELCESWARWVHRGGLAVSGQSVLSKLIDNHGVMNYGSGGSGPALNCVEADIEAALMALYVVNPPRLSCFVWNMARLNALGLILRSLSLIRLIRLGLVLEPISGGLG